MEITVKYFGLLTDITQHQQEQFLIPVAGYTIKDLKGAIEEKYPSVCGVNYTVAVNQMICEEGVIINLEDTIALLPSFAGG